jgi:ADP-heptose:LPS heptosyltransferase
VVFEPEPVRPEEMAALIDAVRNAGVDAALILTSYHQSPLPLALLLRMAGVTWIGAISEDYPGSLLDLRHRTAGPLPESERNLSLAQAAGFLPDESGARLAVRRPLPDATAWTGNYPYIVFHPGASTSARRPTATHSRTLVAALVEAGHQVIVTGSAAEATLAGYVADGRATDLSGRLDLPQLAAVLDGAKVVIAPNTGPAHLAAAVETPVVSLFAPVVPAVSWAPYGVPSVVLGNQEAACRDSRARVCPLAGHPCLTSIRPDDVVAAVDRLALTGVGAA